MNKVHLPKAAASLESDIFRPDVIIRYFSPGNKWQFNPNVNTGKKKKDYSVQSWILADATEFMHCCELLA